MRNTIVKLSRSVPVLFVLFLVFLSIKSFIFDPWKENQNALSKVSEKQNGYTPNKLIIPSQTEGQIINQLTKKALVTYPAAKRRFLEHEVKSFQVRTVFADENGLKQSGYVVVERIENGTIYAAHRYMVGAEVRSTPIVLKESEILDWLIYRYDGVEEGNLTGKYLLEKSKVR